MANKERDWILAKLKNRHEARRSWRWTLHCTLKLQPSLSFRTLFRNRPSISKPFSKWTGSSIPLRTLFSKAAPYSSTSAKVWSFSLIGRKNGSCHQRDAKTLAKSWWLRQCVRPRKSRFSIVVCSNIHSLLTRKDYLAIRSTRSPLRFGHPRLTRAVNR